VKRIYKTEVKRRRRKRRLLRRGVLTVEWILLTTILVIGSIAALSLVRNALIEQFVNLVSSICGVNVGP